MKKAKKIIAILLTAVLIVVALFGGYLIYRFNCNKSNSADNYQNVYSQTDITLNVNTDGSFKILKINDTHFFDGKCANDVKTLNEIKNILNKTPCNLIIVDGDLVDGFNLKMSYNKYQAINQFAKVLESYNTPWTFAPGNNDGEIDGSNEDIISYMMQYKNFLYGNQKGIDGSMQFFIDLKLNGKLVHTVAIMDSGMRKPKAIGAYDYIKSNQINWLLNGVNKRKVKTSIFFHMPTPIFQTAYDKGERCNDIKSYNTYPYNEIKKNKLFDDMISNNKYVSLISCGHEHSNNMCSFYKGRYYQLSSVSGYSAGYDSFIIPSCTLTTINVNDSNVKTMYTFEQIIG